MSDTHSAPAFHLKDNPHFGVSIAIDHPADCDAIVVCVDTKMHVPVCLRLPHQLYAHDLQELLEEYGADSLTIIPYVNAHKVEITKGALDKALRDIVAKGEHDEPC